MCYGELQMQHHAKTTHPKGKSKLHEIRGQPRDERWRKERRGKSSLLLEEQTKNEQERHQTLGVQGRASTLVGQGEADDSEAERQFRKDDSEAERQSRAPATAAQVHHHQIAQQRRAKMRLVNFVETQTKHHATQHVMQK